MNAIKQRILTGWSFIRVLYLVAGITVLISAVSSRQWMAVFVGGYFASMGLFAFGCAGGACFNSRYDKSYPETISNSEEINFEEIK